MKVGIMQPYFFPYIGYFSLIEYSDTFIFFDTPQYINHGWVNRNRVLNCNGDSTYITVPIEKAPRETPINKIMINNNQNWKEKIYGQLSVYKKKAPFYKQAMEIVEDVIEEQNISKLSDLAIRSVKKCSEYIGINTEFSVFSQMNTNVHQVNEPDEWALEITKEIGGSVYVNPPGGMSFFNEDKYTANGIKLEFLESNLRQYIQRIGKYEKGLSIIDIMMFCSINEIKENLNDYHILTF